MELKDLQPIVTLLSQQEERLCQKIDHVHEDVKETNRNVKLINGRLRKAETDLAGMQSTCKERKDIVDAALSDIKPIKPFTKAVNWIASHPKLSLLIGFVIILISQSIVLCAYKREWIGQLFEYIKP